MPSIPQLPYTHWLFKATYPMRIDPVGYLTNSMNQYGGIFEIPAPFYKIITVTNPDYIKHILVTNNKNYIKDIATKKLEIALGNGLLSSEGDFWKRQRRIAQPAFYKEKLAKMVSTMVNSTEDFLKDWEDKKGLIDISSEFVVLTSDIAARSLFGANIEKNREIGKAVLTGSRFITSRFRIPVDIPLWIPLKSHKKFNKAQKFLDDIIYSMIEKRRESQEQHFDLLSMLMDTIDSETGEKMTNKQLRDECITIFSAGHETTANALSWTVYLLDQHQDILQKVLIELKEVLQGRIPRLEDLSKLSYLLKVIQESMRLFPPAWAIGRQPLENDIIGGYQIPKGAQVILCAYATHRNPETWPNPEKFDPERFSPENIKTRHRYAYLPFGGGPRFCIGSHFAMMEMQIVLSMLYQRFQPRLKEDWRVETEALITLRPRKGLMMYLR